MSVGATMLDGFISTATSSHESLPLAVQEQVTEPGEGVALELEAPVIADARLVSHCCVQVGLESVFPPYIAGESSTQEFGYWVVRVTVGVAELLLEFVAVVGIGFVRFTSKKE